MSDLEKGEHGGAGAGADNNIAAHRRPYNQDGPLRQPALGNEAQPVYRVQTEGRKLANPAPLGLCGFALTTFVLASINLGTRGITHPNIVTGAAFGYGGLVQLLAGMWEIPSGNTFGATALSSYGGFWISTAIILTPGGFNIIAGLEEYGNKTFLDSFGMYLMGWFIFTFLLLVCTLRSSAAFFLLFFTLDVAFLFLGTAYLTPNQVQLAAGEPNIALLRVGGAFAMLAAWLAWYNALAGILQPSNSFFALPVFHFPWSDKGREQRQKVDNTKARSAQSV